MIQFRGTLPSIGRSASRVRQAPEPLQTVRGLCHPTVKVERLMKANNPRRNMHGPLRVRNLPGNVGKSCAVDRCTGEPVPNAPTPICGRHLRELYAFASDLIESNWDGAVREYVAGLHDTFKPPRAVKQPRSGWLYFIRFGDRVKVGYSTDPQKRVQGLPHEEVIGFVPGTLADEAAWHSLLAEFHVVGEWFRADPQVIAQLEQVVARSA